MSVFAIPRLPNQHTRHGSPLMRDPEYSIRTARLHSCYSLDRQSCGFTQNSPRFHDLSLTPYSRNDAAAFRLQLDSEADLYPSKFVGRLDNVDSGRADGFRSVEELVRFIEQTVEEIDETARGEMQEPPTEP